MTPNNPAGDAARAWADAIDEALSTPAPTPEPPVNPPLTSKPPAPDNACTCVFCRLRTMVHGGLGNHAESVHIVARQDLDEAVDAFDSLRRQLEGVEQVGSGYRRLLRGALELQAEVDAAREELDAVRRLGEDLRLLLTSEGYTTSNPAASVRAILETRDRLAKTAATLRAQLVAMTAERNAAHHALHRISGIASDVTP